MKKLITPDVPNVKKLAPAKEGLIRVFFKDLNMYLEITPRFFDRYLHCGLIKHTNYYGWMCLTDEEVK